jgi:N-acetylglucosaminyldiphosphoundecaprenol N-acetyl-beta-D-mannosaminyltransferase
MGAVLDAYGAAAAPAPAGGSPADAPSPDAAPARRGRRVQIGHAWVDAVTLDGALATVRDLVRAGEGGSVVTPNVDHLVMLEHDARFRDAYARASLCLADGMPVVWAARLLGTPVPEKVSGSDLLLPLVRLAAAEGWRVFLVGGGPGTAAAAAARFEAELGLRVVGHAAPMLTPAGEAADEGALFARIRAARPDLVFVAFGAPKQEFWIERARAALGPAVAVAVGASLEFVVGRVKRAPAWMSRAGLEWLYRLAQEPRRLWRRYLLRDPQFLLIALRTARRPRATRVRGAEGVPDARP